MTTPYLRFLQRLTPEQRARDRDNNQKQVHLLRQYLSVAMGDHCMLLIPKGQLITPYGPGASDLFHQSVEQAQNLAITFHRQYYVVEIVVFTTTYYEVCWYDGAFLLRWSDNRRTEFCERDIRAVISKDGQVNVS